MANEINFIAPSGQTWKFTIQDRLGRFWNTNSSAFERGTAANWTSGYYYIVSAEDSTIGNYSGSFPSGVSAAGDYFITPRQQLGGSAATADPYLAGFAIYWSGSAELEQSTAIKGLDANGRPTLAALDSLVLHSGMAQTGAAGTITLAAGASTSTDIYKGCRVRIYAGTGVGQSRVITAYNGTTKVATVDWNWVVAPNATSQYAVVEANQPAVSSSLQVSTSGGGDPWSIELPGVYPQGTAGNLLGTGISDVLEADRWIDTSVTPWALVLIKKGSGNLQTGTELLRQRLYDIAGANINAATTVIGRAVT